MSKKLRWEKVARVNSIKALGGIFAITGICIALAGNLIDNNLRFSIIRLFNTLWPNVATELATISITILVIDGLYKSLSIRQEKEERLLQMGSSNNAFALEALRMIRAKGWGDGTDGTLERVMLAGANLNDANLSGLNLAESNLNRAILANAILTSSTLSGATVKMATLTKAKLNFAKLDMANFTGCDLREIEANQANFHRAILNRVKLSDAKLNSSKFVSARCSWANFKRASIISSDFEGAILVMADLQEAVCIRCNLKSVDLSQANLVSANLSAANLIGAILYETMLDFACLYAANLQGVQEITVDQLRRADMLWGAIMPDGSLYDGRYNLKGDIKKAVQMGVDLKNQAQMASFFEVSIDAYDMGQEWFRRNNPIEKN